MTRRADVVISVFGGMYALDHMAAARELGRAAATRAIVLLASWTPASVMPAVGQVLSRFFPPLPSASGPLIRWGDTDTAAALLGASGLHLDTTSTFRLALSFPDVATGADFLIRTRWPRSQRTAPADPRRPMGRIARGSHSVRRGAS